MIFQSKRQRQCVSTLAADTREGSVNLRSEEQVKRPWPRTGQASKMPEEIDMKDREKNLKIIINI